MTGFKQIGIIILGWIFVGFGIVGLFLPFLQGILFIMIGLAILSSRSTWVKTFLKHLEQRYPHHHKGLGDWIDRFRNWFKRD